MGWGSGSILIGEIIVLAKKHIPDTLARAAFYKDLIRTFEGHDWDTQQEAMDIDPVFDATMHFVNPQLFEED
jgi:hypothetical protein